MPAIVATALALLLTGCAPADMRPVHDLTPFEDTSAGTCAGKPIGAYGSTGPFLYVSALAAKDELLYAFVVTGDETAMRVLDASDPAQVHEIGRLVIPGKPYVHAAAAHDDLVLAAFSGPGASLIAVDVSDPTAPVVADALSLHKSDKLTAFAVLGQHAFTDGAGVHRVDLTDPSALRGHTFADRRPFAAPTIRDGLLFSGEWDGVFGDRCWLGVYDADGDEEPTEIARVDGEVCVRAGLVGTPAGLIGAGFLAAMPYAVGYTEVDGAWSPSAPLPLDALRFDAVGGLRAHGDGAVAFGGDGYRHGLVALAHAPTGLVTRATWQPPPAAFVDDVAVTGAGVAWAGFRFESGAFQGVVALDWSGCP